MKFILFILSLTLLLKRIFSLKKLKQDEVIDEKNIEAYVKKLTADNYSLREGIKFLKKEVKEEKKVVIQVTQDKEKLLKDIDNLDQKIEEQIRMLKFEKFLNNQRVLIYFIRSFPNCKN
jgi:homoserine dehydrogenase